MKHRYTLTLLLLLLGVCSLWAAVPAPAVGDHMRVENPQAVKAPGNLLTVHMNLVLTEDLNVPSNTMIAVTPVIRLENRDVPLEPMSIYGRKRYIIAERKNMLPDGDKIIVRRANKQTQVVNYNVTVAFEPWMDGALLVLENDLCGCGNRSQSTSAHPVMRLAFAPEPPPVVIPEIMYCLPVAETVKQRVQHGRAYVTFPVNRTDILPAFMNNSEELAKIDNTLSGFDLESILMIRLHGFASPEGSFENNTRLAEGRTQALKRYIAQKFSVPDAKISVNYTSENWDGLIELAEKSNLEQKDRILSIARGDLSPDAKERELRKMTEAYGYIRDNWLPLLRYTNYEISYVLRNYTAQEAREVAKTNPSELSLREMYDAARLCSTGSDEFYQLIEIAVKTYPDSPEANLNAAAAALERGDVEAAKRYMQKVDMSNPAAKNNREYIRIIEEQK